MTAADEVPPWRYRSATAALGRTLASDVALGRRSRTDHLWSPTGPRRRIHRPIFVVGAPRSGTTYLGDAIGRLPNVSYHFEPIATKYAADRHTTGQWDSSRTGTYLTISYWLLLASRLELGQRFCDKTPQACFLVDLLSERFPDSQFVHIIRDGRDSAVSYREKPWLRADAATPRRFEPGGGRWGPFPRFWTEPPRRDEFRATTDLHRCIWAWRQFTTAAREQSARLPDDRLLEVRYESLVAKPEKVGHQLAAFLGESAGSERLMAHLRSSANAGSVGRWRDLTRDEQTILSEEAGELLAELGYE